MGRSVVYIPRWGEEGFYHKWFARMCEYGFMENIDYILVRQKRPTNNPKNPWTEITNHLLTIDMAKELAMLQRTPKGKEAREYFIVVEKVWNSPEKVMARALEIATACILFIPDCSAGVAVIQNSIHAVLKVGVGC